MKLGTFAALTVAGMTLTSIAVWTATASSPTTVDGPTEANTQPASSLPAPKTPTAEPKTAAQAAFHTEGTLAMEGRLGHAVIPTATDMQTYLYVDVKADPTGIATTTSPLNLSIIIDRSGSMKGQRLSRALDAARTMIGRLRDGDAVSVIAYNTRTEVVVPTTIIDSLSRERATRALSRVRAQGDTCISCGVEAGMRMLGQNVGMVNRILLLSDGEATAGVRDVDGFRRIAERCRTMNTSITSIGVDVDYNERIMATLARSSNGRHFFAESVTALPGIFDQEMQSLTRTVAANAEIVIDLQPGVFLDHVYDRTFRRQGNQIAVPLGTFAAADNKTVLMRLTVPRGQQGARPVADVRLSYNDLVSAERKADAGALIAQASTDPRALTPLDGLVSARVSRSEIAESLEQANALFSSGRAAEARGLIATKKRDLAKRKRTSRRAAPQARLGDLDADFEFQGGALEAADKGFEQAEAGEGRAGAAQVRSNQAAAVDLFE